MTKWKKQSNILIDKKSFNVRKKFYDIITQHKINIKKIENAA